MTTLTGATMAREPSIHLKIKTSLSDKPPALTSESTPTAQPTSKLPAKVGALVKGNNAFALDLYRQLRNQKGNLFFSPYSTSIALAMTYAGARGQTATEMSKVLHFTLEQESLHPAFASLITKLNTQNQQGFQLTIANRLWGQQGYGFLNAFLQLTQENYGAALEEVDFSGSTEEARRTINKWVEQQTHNKIQDLIAPQMINSSTALVLTNAIYFKATWFSQFNPANTKNEPFTVAPGQQVNVPMMSQEAALGYADLGDVQVLELPYVGQETSMVILLPKKVDGFAELEQQLTPEKLENWVSFISQDECPENIYLPKFKVNAEFDLKQVLSKMGMALAFEGAADFSGMNGKKDLSINAAIHKAIINVDEFGTEAAAATAVGVVRCGGGTFRADRPFIFLVRDRQSGSILFLGRVVNPVASLEP